MSRPLLSALRFGDLNLRNRIAFAPCTRCMCPGYLPGPDVAAYYARRAKDGVALQISEGTVICERGNGYPGAPGIWNAEQVKAWQAVTRAVHDAGAHLFCQLWHVGAVAHPLTTGGDLPESPSGLSPEGRIMRLRGAEGQDVHYGESEVLGEQRIHELIQLYADAASRCMEAGFDGVEIHGAHGYLIDQFINLRWNRREDDWGGANRLRFAQEVTRAVLAECGPGRTMFRFSPKMSVAGEGWQQPRETLPLLLQGLWDTGLRLLHASNLDYDEAVVSAECLPEKARRGLDKELPLHLATRMLWKGQLVGVGSLTPERADAAIRDNEIDLAAFGRPLIANADFVSRVRQDIALEAYDPEVLKTLY